MEEKFEEEKKGGGNRDISCQPSAATMNHAAGSQDAALTSRRRCDVAVCLCLSEAESMNGADCLLRFIRDVTRPLNTAETYSMDSHKHIKKNEAGSSLFFFKVINPFSSR